MTGVKTFVKMNLSKIAQAFEKAKEKNKQSLQSPKEEIFEEKIFYWKIIVNRFGLKNQ